ncbi:MAG: hypothetical protein ACT4OZ_05430 [Gemmatimonadota bacterium]
MQDGRSAPVVGRVVSAALYYWLLARPGGRAVFLFRERSAGFARAFRGGGAAAGVDEGIDELVDGALIRGRELFDLLQAFEEPGGFRGAGRLDGGEAEEGVGGDAEGPR